MLFSSTEFIFGFLPVVLVAYLLINRYLAGRGGLIFLSLASLFFYAWWNPPYILLLIGSILVNFFGGRLLMRVRESRLGPVLLGALILANLGVLGYYKYAVFILENFRQLFELEIAIPEIFLALGVSFFTFQQITYLVDVYVKKVNEYQFWHYALFVSFFPQLIAGPIVHHGEILPQFEKRPHHGQIWRNLAIGSTLFVIGLFKKVMIADQLMAPYVNPAYLMAEAGQPIPFFGAWVAVLAYAFQLYFDFSGYSDMAIGLGRMFGVRLPMNFNSPYKATSMIAFWERWHMTMTRFFTHYVYVPISLKWTRHGIVRGYGELWSIGLGLLLPVLITFILSGLWHGAGWNFVLMGLVWGVAMVINQIWRRKRLPRVPAWLGWTLTFLTNLVAQVLFRSNNLAETGAIFRGLVGMTTISLPASLESTLGGLANGSGTSRIIFEGVGNHYAAMGNPLVFIGIIGALFFVCLKFPNSAQFMQRSSPVIDGKLDPLEGAALRWLPRWRPTSAWGWFTGAALAVSLIYIISPSAVHEFIYFQF